MKRTASTKVTSTEGKTWEHPKGSGIRITEIPNRNAGTVFGFSYQVRVPAKLAGKREWYQRKSKEAAERLAEDRLIALRKHGHRFSELPTNAQEEAALAWTKFLKDAGIGFLEAAEAAVRVLRPAGGTRTVADVIAELKESKELRYSRGEIRERTWLEYKSRSSKIENAFGSRPINLISVDDLTGWLKKIAAEGLGDGPLGIRSLKNYRNCLSELFRYAAKKRYCAENPLARLTREEVSQLGGQRNKRAKINRLTVDEAEALLKAAREHLSLGLLPSVVLRLFCGLRTEEIVRLDWHDVRWQESPPYVHISEDKAKGRSARNVSIPENALEWLALCPNKTGPLVVGRSKPGEPAKAVKSPEYCKRFRRLQKLAGFGAIDSKSGKWVSTWETNDTRHSFGTYHFAAYGDSIRTATEMGHRQGDAVLFNHYRALATKQEGERYFALRPEPAASNVTQFPHAATA